MAKSSGITTQVQIDDSGGTLRDISNDVESFNLSTPRGTFDITGLDKSAIEKLLGLADGKFSISVYYNTAATTGSHTVLKTISSNSSQRTVTITPPGGSALSMEMVASNYQLTRSKDGMLMGSADFELANGAVPTWS